MFHYQHITKDITIRFLPLASRIAGAERTATGRNIITTKWISFAQPAFCQCGLWKACGARRAKNMHLSGVMAFSLLFHLQNKLLCCLWHSQSARVLLKSVI